MALFDIGLVFVDPYQLGLGGGALRDIADDGKNAVGAGFCTKRIGVARVVEMKQVCADLAHGIFPIFSRTAATPAMGLDVDLTLELDGDQALAFPPAKDGLGAIEDRRTGPQGSSVDAAG